MHGRIVIDRDGTPHVFTLEDEGKWTIVPPLPDPDMAHIGPTLERVVAGYRGPSDGAFGPRQVREAASYLRLYYPVPSVEVSPVPDGPPGTIY